MTRWMNEDPISEVVVNTPRFEIYESGLLTSARAISRNLNVIARAIELARERDFTTTNPTTLGQYIETARNLATRIRFGIRTDITDTQLGTIIESTDLDDLVNSTGYPEFFVRIILRLMCKRGLVSFEKLVPYEGKKILRKTSLHGYEPDRVTANHIARYHKREFDEICQRIILQAKVLQRMQQKSKLVTTAESFTA